MSKGVGFAKDLIKGTITTDIDKIPNNSGAVVRLEGIPTAVYKNENGEIIKLSAFCTHMNCIVNWNDTEKTWDCPCHGSRFKKSGEVITGPAIKPLAQK
jgi:Rieske Fe-S protein